MQYSAYPGAPPTQHTGSFAKPPPPPPPQYQQGCPQIAQYPGAPINGPQYSSYPQQQYLQYPPQPYPQYPQQSYPQQPYPQQQYPQQQFPQQQPSQQGAPGPYTGEYTAYPGCPQIQSVYELPEYEMYPGHLSAYNQFVFDPNKYSEQYNPWSPSMWLQQYKPAVELAYLQGETAQEREIRLLGLNIHPIEWVKKKFNSFMNNCNAPKPQPVQAASKPQPVQAASKPQPVQPAAKPQPTQPTPQPVQTAPQPASSAVESMKSPNIFRFTSLEQFQQLRQHSTIDSALAQLSELASDLSKQSSASFQPAANSCFIVCNSYTKPSYQLGVGPINDAITAAANHKAMGYSVYFLHDTTPRIFLDFLRIFLSKVTSNLTLYYTGHGAQVRDKNGDEDDGFDEVMVFDTGYIVDDELALYLKKYVKGNAYILLMSDCCHSGTIWDIPTDPSKCKDFPPNIISLSSAADNQTAKQTVIKSSSQGIFTYNFWTLVRSNPTITVKDAGALLQNVLTKFNQEFVVSPTRPEMYSQPIFPLLAQKQA